MLSTTWLSIQPAFPIFPIKKHGEGEQTEREKGATVSLWAIRLLWHTKGCGKQSLTLNKCWVTLHLRRSKVGHERVFLLLFYFKGSAEKFQSVQILTISVHPTFRRIKSKEPPCGHQSNYFTWHQHQEKGNRIWDSQTQCVRVVSMWECCTQRERLVHMTKETQCSAL